MGLVGYDATFWGRVPTSFLFRISCTVRRNMWMVMMQMARPERSHLENHYADLAGRSFFPGLIDYMVRDFLNTILQYSSVQVADMYTGHTAHAMELDTVADDMSLKN